MRGLSLWVLLSVLLWASAGQVSGLQGQASIEREGRTLKAAVGTEVQTGDQIQVAAASRAQLLFYDDTVITLGPGSVFTIEAYDHAAAQPVARFKAAKGALKVMTGQISRAAPQNFQLATQTATIGIRGTHFLGVIERGADTIACTDGQIIVGSQTGAETVSVRAGELTRVAMGQAPEPPRAYTPQELRALSAATDEGGQEAPAEAQSATQGEEESEAAPVEAIDSETVRKSSQMATTDLFVVDGWFYTTQPEFVGYYEGVSVSHSSPTAANPYIQWGKSTVSISGSLLQEAMESEGESVDSGAYDFSNSNIDFVEYWAYPASGVALTSVVPTGESRTYSGQIAGAVMGYDGRNLGEIDPSASRMSMVVDFAAGTVEGQMRFSTPQSGEWRVQYEGTQSGSSIWSSAISGDSSSGYMDGYLLGENGEAIGGDFWLERGGTQSSAEYAAGVFALEHDTGATGLSAPTARGVFGARR